ncbi:MAG: TetR/AcrR family transcriptional regulator [Bacteroides sp.]|nr:TetR/AcrR family transcriptional regulator [Bacteroides sp.]
MEKENVPFTEGNIPSTEATMTSTEEKILKAAEKEFLCKGFDGARTTSIAKAAGVTHAMLHYYFRSKENLFQRIISNKISLLGELMLSSLADSSLPLFDKISGAIERHLDFIASNPELPHFFIMEVYSHNDRMEYMAETLKKNAVKSIASLQRDIDEAAAKGECRKMNAEMLLLDIISLNIFSFLTLPLLENVLPELFSDKERFIALRKKENIDTIMRKLRP